MATIRKRETQAGTRWNVQIRKRGAKPINATFRRKTDAEIWAKEQEIALENGLIQGQTEGKKKTLTELKDRYCKEFLPGHTISERTKCDLIQRLSWWKEQLGHCILKTVTPQKINGAVDVLKGMETRTGEAYSSQTVVHYLNALAHVFQVGQKKWNWVRTNPATQAEKPKLPRGRVRYLEKNEMEVLLEACKRSKNPYLHLIVILALSTGARKGEINTLKWSQVDLNQEKIILEHTKNKERRMLPLKGKALEFMRRHSKIRRIDSDMVFPGPNNPKEPIDFRTAWRNAVRASELADFKFHDLRHCAASYLAMNGATLMEIAAVLGHKDHRMVQRYAHLTEDHTSKVVEDMNEKILGGLDI